MKHKNLNAAKRIVRRTLRRSSSAHHLPDPVIKQPRFDLWLVRVGYIAQVGVLVATVLGFYFTVIPLYQKAALDELIARREAELKTAQDDVTRAKREAYEQFRLNFTQRLAMNAANQCSDVLTTLMQPVVRGPDKDDHAKRISLPVEVLPCLRRVAVENKAADVLTAQDQASLDLLFVQVGGNLEEKRVDAQTRIADLPKRARLDPTVLEPVGDFMREAYEFQDYAAKRLGNPLTPEKMESRFQYQVRWTQQRIADKYRSDCAATIAQTIRKNSWQKEPKS